LSSPTTPTPCVKPFLLAVVAFVLRTRIRMKFVRKARAAAGSVVFLVLAPGVVAGLVPWWLTGWRVRQPLPYWLPVSVGGSILLAAGVVVLLQAFARFVVEGLGTPAPVAPTERLVVGGLYRYVRNPMYLAVAATIVGQALALGQPILLVYGAAFAVAVAAFVHWYEEPTLRRQFGEEYEAYRRAVPAWWRGSVEGKPSTRPCPLGTNGAPGGCGLPRALERPAGIRAPTPCSAGLLPRRRRTSSRRRGRTC